MEQFEISADGRTLSVRIEASLSADEVERLIHKLGQQRERMSPAVAETYRQAMKVDSPVADLDGAGSAFSSTAAGLRMWIRSPGLGWMTLVLRQTLLDDLALLIRQDLPHGGATQ